MSENEGGTNEDSNLRLVCSSCNRGRSNLFIPPEQEAINVLTLIRRKPRDVQLAVLEFLKREFESDHT